MRFFDLFTGLFYSAAPYRYMRYQAQGLGLAYSFILIALTSTLFTLYAMGMVYGQLFMPRGDAPPLLDDAIAQIARQWPEMTIKDGKALTHDAEIYTIALTATLFGETISGDVMTIDTTGATTHQNSPTPLLLTQEEVIARDGEESRIRPLSELIPADSRALILNRHSIDALTETLTEYLHAHAATLLGTLGLVLWAGLTLFYYIARLFLLASIAIAGILLGSLHRSPIGFQASMRLSALAVTPVAMADALALSMFASPLPNLALLGLGIFMLSVAIRVSHEA